MTGATHKVGGVLCVVGGYTFLQSKGLLLNDVNPLLQFSIMYPFGLYGSTFMDLDHGWSSCPSTDIVSLGVNRVLHLTTGKAEKCNIPVVKNILSIFDAKHRSWQTHSVIPILLCVLLSRYALTNATLADIYILRLILLGFILGLISHIILDMLTPSGIWLISVCLLDNLLNTVSSRYKKSKIKPLAKFRKVTLVPRSSFFATDGPWESLIRRLMWILCFIVVIYNIYLMSPYQIDMGILKGVFLL